VQPSESERLRRLRCPRLDRLSLVVKWWCLAVVLVVEVVLVVVVEVVVEVEVV
jgi:hypothetical protein